MHASVLAFVRETVSQYELANRSTLEIGSLDVNGGVRQFFNGAFIGTDMRPGPGVDKVVNSHFLDEHFSIESFSVVISTEMLEHDSRPWTTIANIDYVLQPGGHAIITARGYDQRGCFPVHDYPDDLWRFSVEGAIALVEGCSSLTVIDAKSDPEAPGFFMVARKDG